MCKAGVKRRGENEEISKKMKHTKRERKLKLGAKQEQRERTNEMNIEHNNNLSVDCLQTSCQL